jgi:hypothetical protein
LIGTAVLSFASSQPQSVPRLALIEIAQCEQDLASLAPQRGLIAAQPIEGVSRQIGQADKGACEVVRLIGRLRGQLWVNIETAGGVNLILPRVVLGRDGVSVQAADDIFAVLMSLPSLAELKQLFGLDLEQPALDGVRATQRP